MMRSRLVGAWVWAAAIVASAPFVQQLFTYLGGRSPEWLWRLGVAATVAPVIVVSLVALRRIRDRRLPRYTCGAVGVALGAAYIVHADLTFPESFHFAEYGVLAILFYRVRLGVEDWTIVALPLTAGALVGSIDEWVQWFIPIRAGELRDVALNVIATACGLLVAVALDPPRRLNLALDARSRTALARWTTAAAAVFAVFFYSVHIGHDVHDAEIGSFRSKYTAAQLERAARDRAVRWRLDPPVVQRPLWREDHYLTEALWHVRQRNLAWQGGDIVTAWRENRILEKYFGPVLDTTTYAEPAGHRWPAEQRADAATRVGDKMRPMVTREYAHPLYVWPALFLDRFNSR